ncbi:MAG TPA: hypothetical protein VN026_02645 [Bacteroidia bacterium]|jgi:hypothetical protein|nr:hypothetical protein [Bacteroidia bacterium]
MVKKLVEKITYSGIDHATNSHDRKCILIINRMSIILSFMMITFAALSPIFKIYDLLYFSVPFCIVFSLAPVFNAIGWLTFSKWFFTFSPVVCLVIVCFYNSIEMGDRFFFLTTATIPIILFRKTWLVYFIFYINLAVFLFTNWYQTTHEPIAKLPKNLAEVYWYFTLISVFAVLFYVFRYFRQGSEDHEKELEEKNDLITEKNKEITDSIKYAKRIQQTLMPNEKQIEKNLKRLKENK